MVAKGQEETAGPPEEEVFLGIRTLKEIII